MTVRDVFLCHASEDKASVLRPLVSALESAGITYWYDEAEIRWGDSIVEKVNEGLRQSRYVLVVFSKTFAEKHWPQRELNSALNIEASTGEVRVLPLLVGGSEERQAILAAYPILNDKAFQRWVSDPLPVIKALQRRLGEPASGHTEDGGVKEGEYSGIPMPAIRRRFTQRDKDRFLNRAFEELRTCFRAAARELESRHPEIEVEVHEIHKQKFTCSIYRQGEIVNRCKIWMGGPLARDGISYAEGRRLDIDRDNSCNDWLTVEEGEAELGLRRSSMGFTFSGEREFDNVLSAQKAAEYLWCRATEPLTYA
jgi:hypothetical protein